MKSAVSTGLEHLIPATWAAAASHPECTDTHSVTYKVIFSINQKTNSSYPGIGDL